MKKMLCIFIATVILNPLFVRAVAWQFDSGPFVFPGTGISEKNNVAKHDGFRCGYKFQKGTVTIEYALPHGVIAAKLTIYNLTGVAVESFDLRSSATMLQWDVSRQKFPAGVYPAAIRFGGVEKRIQISIVK